MACLRGEMVKTPGKAGPSWMVCPSAARSEWEEKVEKSIVFSIAITIAFIQNLLKLFPEYGTKIVPIEKYQPYYNFLGRQRQKCT